MANRQISKPGAELKKYLKSNPGTDVMELLIADLAGVLRCKRIRGSEFAKTFESGFCLPGGAVLIDTLGDVVNNIPWSAADGDPDVNAVVVPGSLSPVPWSLKPSAQAMFRFYTRDGNPFFADPRHVLERAAQPIYKMGLKIVMATELEFYLLDANAEKPTALAPKVPGIRPVTAGTSGLQPRRPLGNRRVSERPE